jgi:hypothetical protein
VSCHEMFGAPIFKCVGEGERRILPDWRVETAHLAILWAYYFVMLDPLLLNTNMLTPPSIISYLFRTS